MKSGKLAIVLGLVLVILAGFLYYLFTQSSPKDIHLVENTPQEANQTAIQKTSVTENKKPAQVAKQNVQKKQETPKASKEVSLDTSNVKQELNKAMQNATILQNFSTKRFKVYVQNGANLSKTQTQSLKNILFTLRERAGYLNYSLFVDFSTNKLVLYNESLLEKKATLKNGVKLRPLWFKFNTYNMENIKNSFLLRINLKRDISGYVVQRAIFDGHTDDFGNDEYNFLLGLERSATVASELMRQCQVMYLNSYGKTKPLNKSQNFKNRRVEASFL
ncbi:hypothetical protein DMB92_01440 [Campylobacter sp. MIT 99-7217]|uniref:hypothetical protein n=1 Tax=Campylobacter sp. MIT 99-7217 TaxID=535091 RepID=UPI001159EA1E|nr:hypothetical protein [Campylobacter sp. MIT 99-7217]TQR34651.1 hypothetical protein DMB92_01440 [Campylobacter sp. MIT 99-7217]